MSVYKNPLLEGASDEFRLRVRVEQLEAALAAKDAELERVRGMLAYLAPIDKNGKMHLRLDVERGGGTAMMTAWLHDRVQEAGRNAVRPTPPPDAAEAGEVPHA